MSRNNLMAAYFPARTLGDDGRNLFRAGRYLPILS